MAFSHDDRATGPLADLLRKRPEHELLEESFSGGHPDRDFEGLVSRERSVSMASPADPSDDAAGSESLI